MSDDRVVKEINSSQIKNINPSDILYLAMKDGSLILINDEWTNQKKTNEKSPAQKYISHNPQIQIPKPENLFKTDSKTNKTIKTYSTDKTKNYGDTRDSSSKGDNVFFYFSSPYKQYLDDSKQKSSYSLDNKYISTFKNRANNKGRSESEQNFKKKENTSKDRKTYNNTINNISTYKNINGKNYSYYKQSNKPKICTCQYITVEEPITCENKTQRSSEKYKVEKHFSQSNNKNKVDCPLCIERNSPIKNDKTNLVSDNVYDNYKYYETRGELSPKSYSHSHYKVYTTE